MHVYELKHRVGHSADEMFDLVADIEQYPRYLPLCEGLDIVRRQRRDEHDVLIARMTVGYKLIRETMTTEVLLDRPARSILVEYLDGPFSFLENKWSFAPIGEGACEIHFFIRYAFRSRMLERLLGGVFAKAVQKYTQAFEDRADQVYEPPKFRPNPLK